MTANQKEQLNNMRRQGASYAEIAGVLGISISAVKTFCWRHGSNVRNDGSPDTVGNDNGRNKSVGTLEYIRCENCGIQIRQRERTKPKRFCCAGCRVTWWNRHRALNKRSTNLKDKRKRHGVIQTTCAYCGQPFSKYTVSKQKYCSHPCYIAARFGVRTG